MNAFLIGNGLLDVATGETVALVVETSCRYAQPLRYPGDVDIGLVNARIGTSSIAWHLGVFAGGHDRAAAEGFFTHVCVDRPTGRPVPVPAIWRRVIVEHASAQTN